MPLNIIFLWPGIFPFYPHQDIHARKFVLVWLIIWSGELACPTTICTEWSPFPGSQCWLCALSSWSPEGTTSAYNCETTSCPGGCPAPLSRSPCWAPTLSSQNWETTTLMNVEMTTLVSSALRPITRKSWKTKWSSCTRATGEWQKPWEQSMS